MSSLKTNILYNFIYQLLILILPFLTAPYLSRVLGPVGVGAYSYSYSIALYFTYFVLLGLNKYGNRMIAERQSEYEDRSRVFSEIYSMQITTFMIVMFVYVVYVLWIAEDKILAVLQGMFVASSLFDVNWLFWGMEQFKITVIRNTVIKIITVLCVFIFVKSENDVYIYAFIMAIGTLISQLSLLPFLPKFVRFIIPKKADVLKHVKSNLILFIPVMAVSVYRIMDKIMLGAISAIEDVGFYENAERIVNVPIALITAVGTVMLPRTAAMIGKKQISESKKYLNVTMFWVLAIANAAMFGIIAISNDFSIWYYGDAFEETGRIMSCLAITIIFLACGNVLRTQYLIPNKMDDIYIFSAILGAAVNLVINIILIPKYGAMGAALGTIAAEAMVCLYQVYKIRQNIDLYEYIKYEVVFFIIAIIMLLFIENIPKTGDRLYDIFLQVLVGVCVYGSLVLLIARQMGMKIPFINKKRNIEDTKNL